MYTIWGTDRHGRDFIVVQGIKKRDDAENAVANMTTEFLVEDGPRGYGAIDVTVPDLRIEEE